MAAETFGDYYRELIEKYSFGSPVEIYGRASESERLRFLELTLIETEEELYKLLGKFEGLCNKLLGLSTTIRLLLNPPVMPPETSGKEK